MNELVFLKLGGSLITDKTRAYSVRLEKLRTIAHEIADVLRVRRDLLLVLGHGSGSFGHTAAKEYKTRQGLTSSDNPSISEQAIKNVDYWKGFSRVWFQASALNRFVMEALYEAEIPSVAMAPISSVTARDGKVARWDLAPIKMALSSGLIPVVYGDVIFDEIRGGTILSTEDLFEHLAQELNPQRILLAGLESAVWADFPERTQRIESITPKSFEKIKTNIGASHSADVTGGMESKVTQMLWLTAKIPGLTAQIFSGEGGENIRRALEGENLGTMLTGE